MKYISTRGQAEKADFATMLLNGLAPDKGLYIPEDIPSLSAQQIRALRGKNYSEIAKEIIWPFVEGAMERPAFNKMIEQAYSSFEHPAICPLVQIGESEFVLELFHGPTLAFKDVAMQLLSRFINHFLEKQGKRAAILGATSGDTGSAAIQAFKEQQNTEVFILFPKGRVSCVQQAQITRSGSNNIHPIALEGNFDDCQNLVKNVFADTVFRQSIMVSGVNSINWARICAQIVYYFTAALSLGAPDRPVVFSVPTGNFGDIFAGFIAAKMGLPIAKLIIATNENDILVRALNNGVYDIEAVVHTISPSMDIQISSNFERLLFEASGRDAQLITKSFDQLNMQGKFLIPASVLAPIKQIFSAISCSEAQTLATIKDVFHSSGYILDPHSAIGVYAGRIHKNCKLPLITLATAHPAKFSDVVVKACGVAPAIPERLQRMMQEKEKLDILQNEAEQLKNFIRERFK